MPKQEFLAEAPQPLVRRSQGLTARHGASREELRTIQEMHRQSLAVRAERVIIAIAAHSVADLAKLMEHTGLDLIQHAQATMDVARTTLRPEYLEKFTVFADRVLGQVAHDLLEIQALARENALEILVDTPSFKDLPEEKRSFLRRLLGQ